MEKFKDFIDNWHINNSFEWSRLSYELFLKLREEKYLSQNLLEVASEFIELFGESLEKEWKKRWWDPFQSACISYLLKESGIEREEAKEKIANHLQQHFQWISKNICLQLAKEASKVKNITSRNELLTFLQLFKEHIEIYNQKLSELGRKYNRGKSVGIFYAFQLTGAFQGFTITWHWRKLFENERRSNFLCSPSRSHYLINPEEAILILVRAGLGAKGISQVSKFIESFGSRAEKVYLFTFDTNLSSNLLSELQKANIEVVTVKSIKNKYYSENKEVITLEELLILCKSKNVNFWKDYKYSSLEKENIKNLFLTKAKRYIEFPILGDWYQKQVDDLEKLNSASEILDQKN